MAREESKRVEVINTDDKRQIMAVFARLKIFACSTGLSGKNYEMYSSHQGNTVHII